MNHKSHSHRMKAFVWRRAKELNSGIPWFAIGFGAATSIALTIFGRIN